MNQKIYNLVEYVGKLLGIGAVILFGFTGFTGKLEALAVWVMGGWVVLCLLWALIKFLVEPDLNPKTITISYSTARLRTDIVRIGGSGLAMIAVLGAMALSLYVWNHFGIIAGMMLYFLFFITGIFLFRRPLRNAKKPDEEA